ncbi:MAG: hypothetical protein RBU37_12120 [Myxococcota bacterium]|nr:hypothetical protein [Myxococcota bacterium]
MRDYLAAMDAHIADISDEEEKASATEWFNWCRQRQKVLDPLHGPIRFPDDPEPTDEALRPFLPEWMRRRW